MLPVSDMVGILQCNVCEAAQARLGRPLSPLFGLTTVSSVLCQERLLRQGAIPEGQSGFPFLLRDSLERWRKQVMLQSECRKCRQRSGLW